VVEEVKECTPTPDAKMADSLNDKQSVKSEVHSIEGVPALKYY
jgi:hypothetical protein